MPNKNAARVLMDLLDGDDETPAIRSAAAAALSDLTGAGVVRGDPAYWQAWWADNQNKPDDEFERDVLDARGARLVRLQNRFDRFVAETRAILEELYQRAPEKEKEPILLRYLRSPEPETRALGAKIVQDDFKQTRPITPAVRDQLRGMVADRSAAVRIAVAQALLLLNDAQALDALLAQLAREPDADVRMELARALVPMRHVRVVAPLVKLLRDPSPAVAEVAARGLGSEDLAPLIRKDPQLANIVAVELRAALDRTARPGMASLRAATVDAMGALRSPNLGEVYTRLLSQKEPVAVRRAALRGLGQLGKPNGETWPATAITEALRDPDDTVRQEAVRALKGTADFGHAELLYELIKRDSREKSQSVRDEAWGVLRNLFSDPTATITALISFAERFRGNPERRIEVLKVLAERLTPLNDEKNQDLLASQRQNLGAEYMELARRAADRTDLDPPAREQAVIENAKQADMYFDLALKHYRARDPKDQGMATSNLLELRMDALLASKQYADAATFAANSIAANSANQESMGRKINAEVDRLHRANNLDDALRLIESAKKMTPPLEGPAASRIAQIEAEIRQARSPAPVPIDNVTTPRSAVGSGQ
jgi:HEAT repeat protein